MTFAEESFFKQRRNLLASALLVAFLNIAGGSIKKLNLLGNEIEFSNPAAIPFALGVALSYFLVRFLQYANEIEDKGFKERFLARVEYYLGPYLMKREFKKEHSHLRQCYPKLGAIEIDSFVMFSPAMPLNTAAISFVGKDGGVVVDENELHVSNRELIVPFVRAGIYITFCTRLVTDYVLPLLVAIFAYSTYHETVRSSVPTWL